MSTTKIILTAMIISWVAVDVLAVEQQENTGKVAQVIVYRGQALVTRIIEADLPEGTSEILVPDLPGEILSDSLFAQFQSDARVISVRYREKSIKEDTREEVRKLEDQIDEIKKRIYVVDRDHQHTGDCWQRYNKLWDLTLQGEQQDLNHALLQPASVIDLTEYLEKKSIQWHQTAVGLEQEKTKLEKDLELLNKQLAELRAGRSKKQRQALIYLDSPAKAHSRISLSYLVNNASWLPQYNLRALPDNEKIKVEYNAVIHQASGEDWSGVEVSLSTAQPTTEAGAPVLGPMKVGLISRQMSDKPLSIAGEQKQQELAAISSPVQYRDLTEDFNRLQRQRQDMIIRGKGANSELQRLAWQNQIIELTADQKDLRMIRQQVQDFTRIEGVSVTYKLSGKLTIPSRSDQQLVTITSFDTDADFVFVATPLLTDYVYLQAEAVNNSDTLLLAGAASMYRDGQFAGKGHLDVVPVGKKFTVGFGVESRIQVARELADKDVKSFLGNKVEKYKYRISINNYNDCTIALRLMDSMPYTEDENLGIGEFTSNYALSDNSDYVRTLRPKGILRWDLNLEPNTFDDSATVVTCEYTVKYDNDMHIAAANN
jgi:hypothetical protein